jgi:subtilisin family serine protease
MKKIALISTFSLLLNFAWPAQSFADPLPDPSITSISPTTITPGETVMTITGEYFGSPFNSENNQICFGVSDCRDASDLNDYLQLWSDTEIQVLVPPDVTNSPSTILLRAYFESTAEFNYIESTQTYEISTPPEEPPPEEPPPDEPPPAIPSLSSFSPTTLTPNETIVTITGENFGDYYIVGTSLICFGVSGCIDDTYINYFLVSWSQTEIKVLVPSYVTESDKIYLAIPYDTPDGYTVLESSQTYSISLPPDPTITSFSPTTLTPGQTEVTIHGQGFGDYYETGYNQICFGPLCLSNSDINNYLISWSDTEITVIAPSFIADTSGTIGVRAYFPSAGYYDFAESSQTYTTVKIPTIEWYYYEMEQGGSYVFSGQNFGSTKGKVVLGNQECKILSWSSTEIGFTVPDNASSGKMYIQNAQGVKSEEISVLIISVTKYSDDEFSKYQWQMGVLNMVNAWGITEGSSNVVVAVIDSGVDITHEDIKHAIWKNSDEITGNGIDDDNNGYKDDAYGWDFVMNSNNTIPRGEHGTMVSSAIAAKKDNGIGIAGIAPNVKIMPLNIALEDGLSISVDAANMAIKYAVDNGADIINLSFGGYDSNPYYADALQYAYDNNVLVVAATGNDNIYLNTDPFAPACVDLSNNVVIGVSSIDSNYLKSSFSNYGSSCTDLSAPGEFIPLAIPASFGYYTYGDGTSFASPLVAGIAALVRSKNPTWNVEEVKYVLLHNVTALNNSDLGKGVPDAYKALTASKPSVSYTYNPSKDLVLEKTGAEINIDVPDTEPIPEEPEPIKNESDENPESKNTNPDTMPLPQASFSDTSGYKYEAAIAFVEKRGVVGGYPDGTFLPDNTINRAEFTKILIGAYVNPDYVYGTSCFKDVGTEWFAPYVCTAKDFYIISGYAGGIFKPTQEISTVEALKILLKTANVELDTLNPGDPWYLPYTNYAVSTNLRFIFSENDMNTPITRGQVAELIYLMMTK